MADDSKAFYHLLLSVLHQPTSDSVTELEISWKLQRSKFINLLKHSPKSLTDRQNVKNASSAPGIRREENSSIGTSTTNPRECYKILPQDFVDEALILSDLFDLNELEALKLVEAGEWEKANQADWPRGLCAVYLFYKNRWYQAQTLKVLMRNRQGRYWRSEAFDTQNDAANNLRALIQEITDQLWKDNLLDNILRALQTVDDVVQAEFDKLQQPNVKGLGDHRHRRMVADCLQETYTAIGDALFYWCCQTPLDQREFSSLIRLASKNTGKTARLAIVFSVLQAIDVNILETSDSPEEVANYAPFTDDRDLLLAYNAEICGSGDEPKWADPGAQAVVFLAWAVTIRMVAQNHLTQGIFDDDAWIQDEEDILNSAMQLVSMDINLSKSDIRGPFHWLRRHVMNQPEFTADELYQQRLHSLITQMIVSFPIKMKDWRGEADEECRHLAELAAAGALSPTPPCLHFEQLMRMIGELYGHPNCSRLNLAEIYFCPVTHEVATPMRRIPQSQIALFKFLRTSGEMLPSRLYVAYLRMLSGLACTPTSARMCFDMLRSFASFGSSLSSVSIDNFFAAIEHYLRKLKSVQHQILPDEMQGLLAWFDLIVNMAQQDDSIRLSLFEHPRWSCPATVLGLITCAIPLELKGRALRCLATLAQSPELVLSLSEAIIASGIIAQSETKLGGIQQELEEVESRLEIYPITTGMAKLLAALFQHKTFTPDGPAIRPYVNFVVNSVLLHLLNRNYKTPADLWELSSAVFNFLHNAVDNYDPTVASIVRQSVGCQVMAAFMSDGPIFKTACRILIMGLQWFDEHKQNAEFEKGVREATLRLLGLFHVILSKQDQFNAALIESGIPLQTTSLDVLFQMLNPYTGEVDYVVYLAMYLIHYDRLPEHCLHVIRIIDSLNSSVSAQMKIVKYFLLKQAATARVLRGFVNCLSMDGVDASFYNDQNEKDTNSDAFIRGQTACAVLELLISDVIHGSGMASTLSNFLTGFDLRNPGQTRLENPGIDGTPRTCLHAILDIADASLGQDLDYLPFGELVEPAYRLLFWLCGLPNTAEPTLRYLRNRTYRGERSSMADHGFICQHIYRLKAPDQFDEIELRGEAGFAIREVIGWILKICALELSLVKNIHPSYVATISKLLLMVEDEDYAPTVVGVGIGSPSSIRGSRRQGGRDRKIKRTRRLFEFLAALKPLASKASDDAVAALKLHHFEGVRLSKVVAACTSKTAKGYSKCDVGRLHEILRQEVSSLQDTGAVGQLQLVKSETDYVVETLKRYNDVQQSIYVLRHSFSGFSQTSQQLLANCAMDWLEPEQLDQIVIETIIETLRANLSAAADQVGDLLLSLTTTLRSRLNLDPSMEERASSTALDISGKRYGNLLDGTVSKSGRKSAVHCVGILATALKLLIEATLKTENRKPDVRVSLYGALMNFFRLWQRPTDSDLITAESGAKAFEPTLRERMAEEHWTILGRYANDLVDILAKDAADGSEITTTVAMCCLMTLLEQDAMHGGIARKSFITHGYMNAIRFPPQFQKWIGMLTS